VVSNVSPCWQAVAHLMWLPVAAPPQLSLIQVGKGVPFLL
jgi:hypothetical protein